MSWVPLAAIFNLRRLAPGPCRLLLLVDPAAGTDAPSIVRWLKPWGSWLEVAASDTAGPDALIARCGRGIEGSTDAVLIVSTNADAVAVVRRLAAERGIACLTPELPPEHSREMGLFQEVLHHDVELGGWDYWNKVDSKYAPSVLRLLSTENSRIAFPEYVLPYLTPNGRPTGNDRLRALDIGCGSLSHLRWGAVEGWLDITGVDPLLDMYAVIHERHGLSAIPHLRCDHEICGGAEAIDVNRLADAFDFVLCTNALDHTEDPAAIVRNIGAVLKPGGLAALQVYTREGSREAWWQLHQFDMFMDGERFMAQTRDGAAVDLIDEKSGLEIVKVLANTEQTTRLLARKRARAR